MEKKELIKQLQEKIEKLSGKKIVYVESYTSAATYNQKIQSLEKKLSKAKKDKNFPEVKTLTAELKKQKTKLKSVKESKQQLANKIVETLQKLTNKKVVLKENDESGDN